jgi:enoyl-CoA hydratase
MPPESIQIKEFENIQTEKKQRVGIVTMSGPKGINALSQKFIDEIVTALQSFDADDDIGCMILRGISDDYFSVGANINEMADRQFADAYNEDFFSTGWAKIAMCRKPIIAAVSGYALGGGCELSLKCDIIIAAENAQFGLPEIRLGIFPGAGGTQRLTRQIGKSKAMEMILTGTVQIDAKEAESLGLVSRVVPVDQLIDTVMEIASQIASNSNIMVKMAKEAINRSYESSLAEGLLFERRLFYSALATEDKTEGCKAFLEKREPIFKHR